MPVSTRRAKPMADPDHPPASKTHPSSPSKTPPTKPPTRPSPPAANRVDAYITSPVARAALIWAPLAAWLLTVALGIHTHAHLALKAGQRPHHPFNWFDHLVFRRYGAALPFLFLLPRVAVGRLTGRPATWGKPCLLLYTTFTLLRLALYSLHVLASAGQPQVLSDHIYLAASVVACLQLELVCTVNDAVKAVSQAPDDALGALAGSAGIVLQVVTLLLVSGDMFYTAKYYHRQQESARALLLGLVTFQGPIVWLLWRRPAAKASGA